MGSIAQSVALGIAGGFAAKVIHSAIEEADLNKSNCLTGEAENFVSEHGRFSAGMKVVHIAEYGVFIPALEEFFFRHIPATLTNSRVVNYVVMPLFFSMCHYRESHGEANKPYLAAQLSSALIFAFLVQEGGFFAAFTAHAVSNLITISSLISSESLDIFS